jgi:hypothetical protein
MQERFSKYFGNEMILNKVEYIYAPARINRFFN